MTTFEKRDLHINLSLQNGDRLDIKGLRAICAVNRGSGPSVPTAQVRIYGLSANDINKFTRLTWGITQLDRNYVTVTANGTVVFDGLVMNAWADFGNPPGASLFIDAASTIIQQTIVAPPTCLQGQVSAQSLMQQLAAQMELQFEDNTVAPFMVNNPAYTGSNLDKLRLISATANIDFYIDVDTLVVTDKNAPRVDRGGIVPLISPDHGMIGYPMFDKNGLTVRTLYNPQLQIASHVRVEAQEMPQLAQIGKWWISGMQHELACEMPSGPWFTVLKLVPVLVQ